MNDWFTDGLAERLSLLEHDSSSDLNAKWIINQLVWFFPHRISHYCLAAMIKFYWLAIDARVTYTDTLAAADGERNKQTITSFAALAAPNEKRNWNKIRVLVSVITTQVCRRNFESICPTRNFNKLTKTAANVISIVDDRHEFISKVAFFFLSHRLLSFAFIFLLYRNAVDTVAVLIVLFFLPSFFFLRGIFIPSVRITWQTTRQNWLQRRHKSAMSTATP